MISRIARHAATCCCHAPTSPPPSRGGLNSLVVSSPGFFRSREGVPLCMRPGIGAVQPHSGLACYAADGRLSAARFADDDVHVVGELLLESGDESSLEARRYRVGDLRVQVNIPATRLIICPGTEQPDSDSGAKDGGDFPEDGFVLGVSNPHG